MVLEISAEMEALDSADEWIGLQRYNQACYYALAGHQPRAIELLSQAFPLNPSLLEWSEKDSDLDSLRAALEFQALYPQKT